MAMADGLVSFRYLSVIDMLSKDKQTLCWNNGSEKDNYAKLTDDMVETVNASVLLKEKLAEAENAISVLRDEKGTATCTIEKITQELEDELEQKRAIVAELEALRRKHRAMTERFLTLQAASEKAEAGTKSISLKRVDLARVSFWVP